MFPPSQDFYRLAPEIVLCATGALLMLVEPFLSSRRRRVAGVLALLGAVASLASTFYLKALPGKGFNGLLAIDGFSFFFHVLVGAVAALVILGSADYLEREQLRGGEYYALVLFATAGMGVMASAQELVTGFIGLEMSSISSYILAGYRRDAPKSNESAMKYFLLGSFATAFFLYGIALLLRIFATVTAAQDFWFWALWIAAALTMFVGNLGALVQTNLKRQLAYSSIAHAGYILVAFAARSEIGLAAVLYYLLAYALMKLGAFTAVAHLGGTGERHLEIDDYAGLGQRQPFTAAALSLFLLSLLGLPITAGFLGKFYIFKAALDSGLIWLAVLMAVNSVIGAYYYLRVIVVMYMREPQQAVGAIRVPVPVATVLLLASAATVYLGLFPNRVMGFVSQAGL